MEVMAERRTDSSLWGASLSSLAHPHAPRVAAASSLPRSESAPQEILEAFSKKSSLKNPKIHHARSQSMSQPFDFLPSNDEHTVSFALDNTFLEDDTLKPDEGPISLPPPSRMRHSPGRPLAEMHAAPPHRPTAGNRPPTQPSSLGGRRFPSRSRSSFELAGILNGSNPSVPSASLVSGRERALAGSNARDRKVSSATGSSTAHWPKSVFDMIQDDFPRTPSPMLSSLVPSKTVSTARELRNVQLHPRLPAAAAARRARAMSSAALDEDYDLFGCAKNTTDDAPPAPPAATVNDFDAMFGLDEPVNPSRLSSIRGGHKRSASINWTGDLAGLLDDHQNHSKRSSLKLSKSSILFPTIGENSSSSSESIQQGPSDNSGLHSPPNHGRSSPLNNAKPSSVEADAQNIRGQLNSNANNLHSNFAGGNPASDPNAHIPPKPLANEQPSVSDFDFPYLYDQQEPQFTSPSHLNNHIIPNNPHVPSPNVPQYANQFAAFQHQPPAGFNPLGGAYGPQAYRDNMAAADSLKNMSMQMAVFFQQQQAMYAAQMSQMAALTGMQFNPANVFNPPNAASMFASHMGLQPTATAHNPRTPWETRDQHHRSSGGPRTPRGYADGYKGNANGNGALGKKEGTGGKNRGSRGRRGNRAHDDTNSRLNSNTGNGGGNGVPDNHSRSPLLEDFRSTSSSIGRGINSASELGVTSGYNSTGGGGSPNGKGAREWTLSEIKGHILEFATDQHGSRFIQQKLEVASNYERRAVLDEAMSEAQRLMTDVFGNYVVQKLLDHGGEQAVSIITNELEGRMLSLSLHMYGCRVVQKALEVIEPKSRAKLVRELDGHVLKCIRDQNGNHVIQKCVELVETQPVQFIVNAVIGQAVVLAGHSYGCRVVQRILEHGAASQKELIMEEIMANIPELIKDQYGNYVIQHVVEHGDQEERGVIMALVRGQVCKLSQHKFASNVVERCLQFGSASERETLVELLTVGEEKEIGGDGNCNNNNNMSPLNELVRDQFGNYVVQRILDVAKPEQREKVAAILKSQVPAIKKYSYGKHIIARLDDAVPSYAPVSAAFAAATSAPASSE